MAAAAALELDWHAIEVGAAAHLKKTITREDIEAFAALSGDYNPLHMDCEFARRTTFQKPVAHGMLLGSFVSTMIGMQLPGAGALWTRQAFRWLAPVFAGDTIAIELRVTHKSEGANTLTLAVEAVNQDGKRVMDGEGGVRLLERPEKKRERPLSERVAFVTGSGRGIGRAVAEELAREGVAVAVNYRRDRNAAQTVADAIRERGGRALPVEADITDRGAIEEAFARVEREWERPVDVLVNNAAAPFTPKAFGELDWQEVEDLLAVQVRGAFYCAQRALPGMLAEKSGVIVNIGSILTTAVPPAQWTAFVMAKAALAGWTRALAAEYGPQGIRVNLVSPAMTATDAIGGLPERLRKVQAMQTPLRRLAEAEDVARAVVFLCSGAAGFLTGVDLPVSGGISL